MMRSLLFVLCACLGANAFASESVYPLDHIEPDLNDQASLQRGMQTYVNYCLGCHTLKYQRFNRTAKDIGIPEGLMLEHLIFDPDVRIGELIENSLKVENARNWFGAAPPDLTLLSNLKGGPDWIYTYLRTFYLDESRPFGVNNMVFENVGMPHVLINLQGVQRKVCKQIPELAPNGGEKMDPLGTHYITEEVCGHELIERGYSPLELDAGSGSMTKTEFDQLAYDLSNFLYYVGEPARMDRHRIGVFVLLFLAFFYVFTRLLGREYEKEYH